MSSTPHTPYQPGGFADVGYADTDELIEAFWAEARVRGKLNPAPSYMGVGALESVRPAAWAFGDTPELADELAALVVAGKKTATSSALRDYEAEGAPLPQPGDLGIVLDGAGRPRALIVTTDVQVVPFNQVSEEHARAEGEGDLSLDYWRREHAHFFGVDGADNARTDTKDAAQADENGNLQVVLERFKLLVTADGKYHR